MVGGINNSNYLSLLNNSISATGGAKSVNSASAVDFSNIVAGNKQSSTDYIVNAQKHRQEINDFYGADKSLDVLSRRLSGQGQTNASVAKGVNSTDVAITGSAKTGAKLANYEVDVSQIAKGQINQSDGIAASGSGAIASGRYDMELQVNGQTKKIAIDVASGDTNKQAMDKIAKAMTGAGLTAEVKTDGSKIALAVSGKTGSDNGFKLADINGSSLASQLNLNNKVQSGQNAKFTVNGTAYDQADNKVSLDDGNVTLNLNTATAKTAKVTVGISNDSVKTALKDVLGVYNSMVGTLNGASDLGPRGGNIMRGVQNQFTGRNGSDLAAIGVTMGSNGTISLDEKKFNAALSSDSDKVKQLLSGGGGLGTAMTNTAQTIRNTSPESVFMPAQRYRPEYGGLFVNMVA